MTNQTETIERDDKRNAVVVRQPANGGEPDQANPVNVAHRYIATDVFSDPLTFEHAQRVAKVFASSTMVPKHLRGSIANCLIAYHIARRLNEDPLTVMRNIYFVNDQPGWKTEYMIARANLAGVFKTRIVWKIENEGENLSVTATAVLADSGEAVDVTCDMKMARADGWTKNAKYTSMPEHMLRWRSAAMLIRLYAPEVMLGMPVVEELETLPPPPRDITPAMTKSLDEFANPAVKPEAVAEQANGDTAPESTPPQGQEAKPTPDAAATEPDPEPRSTEVGESQTQPKETTATSGAGLTPAPDQNPKSQTQLGKTELKTRQTTSGAGATSEPKNEREYIAFATAWREALTDPVAGETRWKSEKNVRNKANVSPEARDDLEAKLKAKCAELRNK